jgi:cytochrome c oxidase subunit 2
MANMLADDSAIRNVTAYIETFEASSSTGTLGGNPDKGAAHFTTCGACHGARAQGNYALQAPRLAGQEDWYLKRQLKNFRLGIRGAHKEDTYGHQMVLMARSLQDEQSINDLLAYLNTL